MDKEQILYKAEMFLGYMKHACKLCPTRSAHDLQMRVLLSDMYGDLLDILEELGLYKEFAERFGEA